MTALTPEEALTKRNELVEMGYTIFPDVMQADFVQELRIWSDNIFARLPVDPKLQYQGSDIHVVTERKWKEFEDHEPNERTFPDPMCERMIDLPKQWEVCREIGLEGQTADDIVIILSKPGYGPPLYWHQDFMRWNDPVAATPWPTRIFLSYYLTDTNQENGCLRVIPGTHLKRIKLHELLPAAHGEDIQAIDDMQHPAFLDHPDAIDLPCKAGDLVIADARILHAAWPNQTDQRRTLLLAWHHVFPFPGPPSWWEGDIPEVVRIADPSDTYEGTRIPGQHLPY